MYLKIKAIRRCNCIVSKAIYILCIWQQSNMFAIDLVESLAIYNFDVKS